MTRRYAPNSPLRYKGVSRVGNKYQMAYWHEGKTRYGGTFPTEQEAARAYDEKMRELHGQGAVTNESLGKFNGRGKAPLKNEVVYLEDNKVMVRLPGPVSWAIIDADDLDKIRGYRCYEAAGTVRCSRTGEVIALHRLLTGAGPGESVYHRDGNPMNCRKANLKVVSSNQAFTDLKDNPYRGVYWDKRRGTFVARIQHERHVHYLGAFTDPAVAAERYDQKARELYGDQALTNEDLGLL